MHIVVPDVGVSRLDGIKELLVVVGLMVDQPRAVFNLDPLHFQEPGIPVILLIL